MTATPVTQYEVTPQWPTYLDLTNDVEPFLLFTAGLTIPEVQKKLLQDTTDMACTWVQNYLDRPVAPIKLKRLFSGWSGLNGSYIALPYYPVISVEALGPEGSAAPLSAIKVNEVWGTSGPHLLEEQTPENQGGAEVFQLDPLRGFIIRAFQGLVQRPFFPGSRNIEVVWWAGYDPVPADIRRATLILVAHYWRTEMQASRGPAKPLNEFDEQTAVSGEMFLDIPHRTKALLAPYTQIGMG